MAMYGIYNIVLTNSCVACQVRGRLCLCVFVCHMQRASPCNEITMMHRTKRRPPLPFTDISSNSQDSLPTTSTKQLKVCMYVHSLGIHVYRRRWLLSACTYSLWQQGNMRLTNNKRNLNQTTQGMYIRACNSSSALAQKASYLWNGVGDQRQTWSNVSSIRVLHNTIENFVKISYAGFTQIWSHICA